jgi:anti-anti-sigma factor
LTNEIRGRYLLIEAKGRLDASWADYFTDALMNHVRNGHHDLILNASGMAFLSSAGIRALLQVYKELIAVRGSFRILQATDFVKQTLSTSGFEIWLGETLPEDLPDTVSSTLADSGEHYVLNALATLTLTPHAAWLPWQKIDANSVHTLTFPLETFALGIGSAAESFAMAREQFGEFLAVAGNVVYQPPAEGSRPDYLLAEKAYIPAMQCLQALISRGEMATLFRFAPSNETPFFSIGALLEMILKRNRGKMAGFVILGEIEGLVGAALIQSPGLLSAEESISFPEVKEWLSFSGERVFAHQQALLTGMVKERDKVDNPLLPPLPSHPELAAHIHAAVFPYQPLQNGNIDMAASVQKFFSGPPPLAVMHLVDDMRPAVGLGQSALIRGACWCAPVQNPEVLS